MQQRRMPDLLLVDPGSGDAPNPPASLLAQLGPAAVPVVLLSARRDDATRIQASADNWTILEKPARPSALRSVLMQARLRLEVPAAGAA